MYNEDKYFISRNNCDGGLICKEQRLVINSQKTQLKFDRHGRIESIIGKLIDVSEEVSEKEKYLWTYWWR